MCNYANNVLAFFENLDETIKCDLLKNCSIFSDVSIFGDDGGLQFPQTCSMTGGSKKQKGGNTPQDKALNCYCETVLTSVFGQISEQLNAFIYHKSGYWNSFSSTTTPGGNESKQDIDDDDDEWLRLKNFLLTDVTSINFISDLYINTYNVL